MIYMNLRERVETFKAAQNSYENFDEHLGLNKNFSHRGAAWYFQKYSRRQNRKKIIFENVILSIHPHS